MVLLLMSSGKRLVQATLSLWFSSLQTTVHAESWQW